MYERGAGVYPAPRPLSNHTRAAPRTLELIGEPDRRLGASRVETAEAPRLEDGLREVAVRLHEVALADVHHEVVAHDVVDVPERLHVPAVHRIDGEAEHRDDRAAAVERERREREQGLPVADLVAEGHVRRPLARGQVEPADQA